MHEQTNLEYESSSPEQLLPHHGEAIYYGRIFDKSESQQHFDILLKNIPWKHDEVIMFGKHITTDRKVAWFGDQDYDYTYSGQTRTAQPWTPELQAIKEKVEAITGAKYNSCLMNLYADGTESMGWHQDNEKCLGKEPNIASISFGAERRFDFRDKQTRERVSVHLENGSLLEMKGTTQTNWQHQIPKSKKITTPRVNLTFRYMHE